MALHLEQLNPEQLAAVTAPDEHLLVLAGAGSGKTRVLTTRIAWLVNSGRVSPAGVLAVTFTNKAAREMYVRLAAMLAFDPRGMWIGTFHGLANRMLRAHHREAGLPREFQILDAQDQLAAVKRVLRALGADPERDSPREVQAYINARKEEGLRAGEIAPADARERRWIELYAAYDEQCRREGVADFAELLLASYELLARNALLREHYAARFRHILVDEFQDTNRLQYRWLKLLASGGAAVFAVGDDDQSIYRFRGAHVGNMADFEREFGVRRLVRLERNYRSHGNILAAANALIARNRHRLGKNLWTEAGAGEPLVVYEAESDAEEAAFVVEQAQALARSGVPLSAIAVLYRSNAQSRVIEHALFTAGLPYRVYGGLRFFERAEVKHALAYLRLLAHPGDDAAFLRVANFPPRGIGARTLEVLADAARARGESLWQAVEALEGRARQALGAFRDLVVRLRAETAGLALAEQVAHVIAASGLEAHYRAEREGAERLENLGELVNAAATFAAEERASGLATGAGDPEGEALDPLNAFLAHAALEAGEHQAGEGREALQLMTVHAAKGLEFDAVFLAGLEDGLFPHEQSLAERDGLEEERRLAYVAITRARHRLYLSYARTRMLHGQTRYALPSRFLDEIPPGLVRWLAPRRPEPAPAARAPQARRPARAGAPAGGFRVGQSVVHPKFGAGVIVDAEGDGAEARVQVNFGREGVKWLAVAVAKLEPA
ncbi:MAG: UvrD-helicase domain-containing protein [Burkholderiales bacterium]|nr:UvrD-helicase domain-containing protein [Burkholderiales bacterium]